MKLQGITNSRASTIDDTLCRSTNVQRSYRGSITTRRISLVYVHANGGFNRRATLLCRLDHHLPILAKMRIIRTVDRGTRNFVTTNRHLSVDRSVRAVDRTTRCRSAEKRLFRVHSRTTSRIFTMENTITNSRSISSSLLIRINITFVRRRRQHVVTVLRSLQVAFVIRHCQFSAVSCIMFRFLFDTFSNLITILSDIRRFVQNVKRSISRIVLVLRSRHDKTRLSM